MRRRIKAKARLENLLRKHHQWRFTIAPAGAGEERVIPLHAVSNNLDCLLERILGIIPDLVLYTHSINSNNLTAINFGLLGSKLGSPVINASSKGFSDMSWT